LICKCQLQDPSQRTGAEKTLQDFRSSAKPYEVCKYILENSKDEAAQFQAVLALRDASIREWDTLPGIDFRLSLVHYLLSNCVDGSVCWSQLVIRQLSACAGVLMKRIWGELNGAQRESILGEIANITVKEEALALVKCRAVELMRAVVVEFNPCSTSEMGLPWEYHYECKLDLENNFLPKILFWAISCAQVSCAQAVQGTDSGLCAASLSLISSLLIWDSSKYENREKSDIFFRVRPPEVWRELILGASGDKWPLEFLKTLSSGIRENPGLQQAPVGSSYMQLINNLSCMDGSIFLDQSSRAHLGLNQAVHLSIPGHIQNLLHLILPDLIQLETNYNCSDFLKISSHIEMLLGACRVVSSICGTYNLSKFVEAVSTGEAVGLPGPNFVFDLLSNVTVLVIALSKSNDGMEECVEILLEMWTELSSDYDLMAHLGPLHNKYCSSSAAVFCSYLDHKMQEAIQNVHSDEEDFEGEEEAYSDALFGNLASIGRSSHHISLAKLVEHIENSKERLKQAISSGADPSASLEELCYLLKISSFILADAGDGETPLIPQIFIDSSLRHNLNENLVVHLSKTILILAMDFKSSVATGIASSRLMEELCKSLGRWADTYLLLDCRSDTLDAQWNNFIFNSTHEGPSIVNFLVELAMICLTKFPGDRTLHLCASQSLLKPLMKHEKQKLIVSESYSWKELSSAYLQNSEAMKILESEVHLNLTEAICSCYSTSLGANFPSILQEIVKIQVQKVNACARWSQDEFDRPDRLAYSLNALSSLRGASRSGCSKFHDVVFLEIADCFPAALQVLSRSKHHTIVYNKVLDLAADIVEYHAPFVNDQDSRGLFQWAIEIVRLHSSDKVLFQIRRASVESTIFEDECDALISLIRLLTQITNAETCRHDDIAVTVFTGVESIMPLLTTEHLKVPQIRHDFFHLLAYMIEVYASKVAEMSPQSLCSFLQAIAFGVQVHDDFETDSAVFDAIGAFAKFSIISKRNGGPSVGENENAIINNSTPLLFLFDTIMARIIYNDSRLGAIDLAAEPCLSIMSHDPNAFVEYLRVKIFRESALNEQTEQTVLSALQEMHDGLAKASSLDRPSKQIFRNIFRSSIIKLRGVIRRQ
jgi:hypothetical protein